MQLVDSPALQPGHCVVTRTSTGPFVDTGIDFDDLPTYGRLYLSKDMIVTAAGLFFDMVPAERLTAAQDQLAGALERIAELEAQTAAYDDVRAALGAIAEIVNAEPDVDDDMLDELALLMPPPDTVAGIMEWVDADPTEADVRRLVAVHVEKRKPEHERRKGVMGMEPS